MRILNITAQKPDSTGSGTYLAEMVSCQCEMGHEAAVVCGIDRDDPLPFQGTLAVYPVRFRTEEVSFAVCGMSDQMPYRATRYCDMNEEMVAQFRSAFAKRVKQAIDDFAPDIVVCHHLYLLTALVRQLVRTVPVFAICHSTDLRQMAKHNLEREDIIAGIRGLDGIFALHEAQVSEIVEVYGADPSSVRVLGTGFNERIFNVQGRRRKSPDQPLSVLYVGKIWEKKGVGCLLDAWDSVDFGCPAKLTLVGGHNDEEEYLSYAQRAQRCSKPVTFAGKLNPVELAEVYRSSDVFVLPSFFEGLPLVVVEALACGCRVAVSDLPGIRPWLTSFVPQAPVVYIKPPAMRSADEPIVEELPGFTQRIAQGLKQAAALKVAGCDMAELTWEGLTKRFINLVSPFAPSA